MHGVKFDPTLVGTVHFLKLARKRKRKQSLRAYILRIPCDIFNIADIFLKSVGSSLKLYPEHYKMYVDS